MLCISLRFRATLSPTKCGNKTAQSTLYLVYLGGYCSNQNGGLCRKILRLWQHLFSDLMCFSEGWNPHEGLLYSEVICSSRRAYLCCEGRPSSSRPRDDGWHRKALIAMRGVHNNAACIRRAEVSCMAKPFHIASEAQQSCGRLAHLSYFHGGGSRIPPKGVIFHRWVC